MKHTSIIKALICVCLGVSASAFAACKSNDNQGASNAPIAENVSLKTEYISNKSITLGVGEQFALTVANATVQEWTTSNAAVATVENGVVSGITEGIAFIEANTEAGKSFVCMVNVTSDKGVINIELSAVSQKLYVGDVFALSASVYVNGEKTSDVVTWSNSAEDIVNVTHDGNYLYIEALKAGTAQIGATKGTGTATLSITVQEETDTRASYENPVEMTGVPVTEMLYMGGVTVGSVEEGTSSTLYEDVIYDIYEETDSLAMFATLSDGQREFAWGQTGHYAYGFLVEPIYVYDSSARGTEGTNLVYYAVEGALSDGRYGVVVKDVPSGYYEIRSFVEYEKNGTIVREVSSERAVAGEYNPAFVDSAEQLVAVSMHINGLHGANVGFYEYVDAYKGNAFTDVNNVTKDAKYVVEGTPYLNSRNENLLPCINVKARTPMTERMLKELTTGKISTISFSVCYKTEKTCKGILSTLNLNSLTKAHKATTAHFNPTMIDYSFYFSNKQLKAWRAELEKVYINENCYTNTWYTITMSVDKLLEYYDILFDPHSGYNLFGFSMSSNKVAEGETGIAELLISDFVIQSYELDNLAPTANSLNVNRAENGGSAPWGMDARGCTTVEAIPNNGEEKITWTDDKGVTKDVAYSFDIPVRATQDSGYGHYMLIIVDLSYLSKDALINLQKQGYTELTVSFVYHNTWKQGIKLATMNMDWLRADPTGENGDTSVHKVAGWHPSDSALPLVNRDAFTITTPADVEADDWVTIKYQLSDLIELYDKLFIGKYMVLGAATANYVNTEPAKFYLSNIAITKE